MGLFSHRPVVCIPKGFHPGLFTLYLARLTEVTFALSFRFFGQHAQPLAEPRKNKSGDNLFLN